MKRETIQRDIGNYIEIDTEYWAGDDPYSIDDLISLLQSAKEDGATDIKIEGNNEIDYVHLQPVIVREETDKEMDNRIEIEQDMEQRKQKEKENNELLVYERLKRKYG